MSKNTTNTYQMAKDVFNTLGLKEHIMLDIPAQNMGIFRKHLSEMVKRKQSTNRYATRAVHDSIMVIRIQ